MTSLTVQEVDAEYVDEKAACKIIGFSVITLQQWRSRGTGGPPWYKPGTKILYKRSELEAFMQQHRHVPAATQLAARA
jgi:hypothetical protein